VTGRTETIVQLRKQLKEEARIGPRAVNPDLVRTLIDEYNELAEQIPTERPLRKRAALTGWAVMRGGFVRHGVFPNGHENDGIWFDLPKITYHKKNALLLCTRDGDYVKRIRLAELPECYGKGQCPYAVLCAQGDIITKIPAPKSRKKHHSPEEEVSHIAMALMIAIRYARGRGIVSLEADLGVFAKTFKVNLRSGRKVKVTVEQA
jgi:hypothetical protein